MGQSNGRLRRNSSIQDLPVDDSVRSSSGDIPRPQSVHKNLVRERGKKVLIEDVYEVVGQIGQGGLCTVYKIKKNTDKIGGSSRPELRRKSFFRHATTIKFRHHSMETPDSYKAPLYFALKEINLKMVDEDKIDQLKNEVEILKGLDHMNIIKAYETFQSKTSKKLMIVMELCTGGDLFERLPYTECEAATITKQILSAVSFMHKHKIIHRDLKFENIIFETRHPEAPIKVIDFGLSKEYGSSQSDVLSERVGTLYSMSPETMQGSYDAKADLWSVGVCTYMLLAGGTKPFEGQSPKELVQKVLKANYSYEQPASWETTSDLAKSFIDALLVIDPKSRPSASEAWKHEWIVTQCKAGENLPESLMDSIRKCLIRYKDFGPFRKLALNVIAKRSTSAEIFSLRKAFRELDTMNDGIITLQEFQKALGAFNFADEEIHGIFQSIDVNQNNEVNYTEFLAACLEAHGELEEYRLAEAFDLLDSDDSGYITRDNLRQILGGEADEAYISMLVNEVDPNRKGKISYAEFLRVFSNQFWRQASEMLEVSRIDERKSTAQRPDTAAGSSDDSKIYRRKEGLDVHAAVDSTRSEASGRDDELDKECVSIGLDIDSEMDATPAEENDR